jgi:hypothetical protein
MSALNVDVGTWTGGPCSMLMAVKELGRIEEFAISIAEYRNCGLGEFTIVRELKQLEL